MNRYKNTDLNSIPKLAEQTAKTLKGGQIFALLGPLGSGKTTFVKAVGKNLKIKHKITSPTFSIVNRYPLKLAEKNLFFYHIDLYRTKNIKEIKALGLTEFLGHKTSVTFIEWADKIKSHLPKKARWIKFKSL